MISTGFLFAKEIIGIVLPIKAIVATTPNSSKKGIGPKLKRQKKNLLLITAQAISQATNEIMKFANENSSASNKNILVIPRPLAPNALNIPNSRFFSFSEEIRELKSINIDKKHKIIPEITKTLIVIGSVKKLYAVSNSAYLVVNVAEILYVQ